MFLWISPNFCPLILLLIRSYQAKIIIVKRLIQGRNSLARVRIEPKSCDPIALLRSKLKLKEEFLLTRCLFLQSFSSGLQKRIIRIEKAGKKPWHNKMLHDRTLSMCWGDRDRWLLPHHVKNGHWTHHHYIGGSNWWLQENLRLPL